MKKTKVVCTMGPNTNDRELLKKLIENGMDVRCVHVSKSVEV